MQQDDTGTVHRVQTTRGNFALRVFGEVDSYYQQQSTVSPPPLIFFVHGAGMSSLSIAPVAKELLKGANGGDGGSPAGRGGTSALFGRGGGGNGLGLSRGGAPPRMPAPRMPPPLTTVMGGAGSGKGAFGSGAGAVDDGSSYVVRTAAIDLRFHGETLLADGQHLEDPVAATGGGHPVPIGTASTVKSSGGFKHPGELSSSSLSDDDQQAGASGTEAIGGEEDHSLDDQPLSAVSMVEDVATVIDVALTELFQQTHRIFLVGHSLGGALLTRIAHHPLVAPRLAGAVVVDVVEGTARAALGSMSSFLSNRPRSFEQQAGAVRWFLGAGGMKNPKSASIVVPSLLIDLGGSDDCQVGSSEEQEMVQRKLPSTSSGFLPPPALGRPPRVLSSTTAPAPPRPPLVPLTKKPTLLGSGGNPPPVEVIDDDSHGDDHFQPHSTSHHRGGARYIWRTNLEATIPFWQGWFMGMDKRFVSIPCPKMLLVANTDRLDTDLTVAQMQGKFQFEVIKSVDGSIGHYLLEDDPVTSAAKLRRFVKRIDVLTKKLPPPVIRRGEK